MTYCAYEQDDFPDDQFERDDQGVLWHKVEPRHTALGEEPSQVNGIEEAPADE
jgi:hypothetical protein